MPYCCPYNAFRLFEPPQGGALMQHDGALMPHGSPTMLYDSPKLPCSPSFLLPKNFDRLNRLPPFLDHLCLLPRTFFANRNPHGGRRKQGEEKNVTFLKPNNFSSSIFNHLQHLFYLIAWLCCPKFFISKDLDSSVKLQLQPKPKAHFPFVAKGPKRKFVQNFSKGQYHLRKFLFRCSDGNHWVQASLLYQFWTQPAFIINKTRKWKSQLNTVRQSLLPCGNSLLGEKIFKTTGVSASLIIYSSGLHPLWNFQNIFNSLWKN